MRLRENGLSDQGASELVAGLSRLAKPLKRLDIGEPFRLTALDEGRDTGELPLGTNTALALKDLLQTTTTLASLHLGGAKGLSTQDWIHVPALPSLAGSWNRGMGFQIGEGLAKNTSIERLNLDYCEMGDKSLAYLCKSLADRPSLRILDLDGPALSSSTWAAVDIGPWREQPDGAGRPLPCRAHPDVSQARAGDPQEWNSTGDMTRPAVIGGGAGGQCGARGAAGRPQTSPLRQAQGPGAHGPPGRQALRLRSLLNPPSSCSMPSSPSWKRLGE